MIPPTPLIEYVIENKPVRCKGKADTDKAATLGWYFGLINVRGQAWAIVVWDSDKEPNFYKPKLLLIKQEIWVPL